MKLKLVLTTAIVGTVASLLGAAAPAQAAPFVYITSDSGFQDPGKILQYDIGAGGQLTPLSPPAVATGLSPRWVAVSPDGKSLYVTGYSLTDHSGEVFQYDIGANGTLSPKDPPYVNVGGGFLGGVAISPDGKSVYVINDRGHEFGATISQYDVGAGGALSPKTPPTVPTSIFGHAMAVSPDGKSLYVTDFYPYISQYDIGANGTLSPKDPPYVNVGGFPGGVAFGFPGGVAISPDGKSVYVPAVLPQLSNQTKAFQQVFQYDVGTGGALLPKNPPVVAGGSARSRYSGWTPAQVAVSPDGKSVYVTDGFYESGGIFQYDVRGDGTLLPKTPPFLETADFRTSLVAVSPDGKSVYVSAYGLSDNSGFVFQYDVGAGGTLSPKNPAMIAIGPGVQAAIAITPLPRVPTRKEQCKGGGWRNFPQFKNQGQCIAFVSHGP